MRRTVVILLALALAAGACRPAPLPPPTELTNEVRAAVQEELREALDDLFAAISAHDPDRILEHYADRADFAYIGALSPQFGSARLEEMVRSWAARHADVTVAHRVVHVQVLSSTVATAFTQGQFSNAETSTVWTHVLVRGDDGRWRVVLEHEVWPGAAEPGAPHPM
jgi:uncharacterized protein (TIGR02246 family)